MSRGFWNTVVMVLAALALLVPLAPQRSAANEKNVIKDSVSLSNPVTIGGKQLKPGDYAVVADAAKVTFSHNGKIVAEAPIEWKDGGKSTYSTIVTDSGQLREVHFRGKSRYVEISSGSTSAAGGQQ